MKLAKSKLSGLFDFPDIMEQPSSDSDQQRANQVKTLEPKDTTSPKIAYQDFKMDPRSPTAGAAMQGAIPKIDL